MTARPLRRSVAGTMGLDEHSIGILKQTGVAARVGPWRCVRASGDRRSPPPRRERYLPWLAPHRALRKCSGLVRCGITEPNLLTLAYLSGHCTRPTVTQLVRIQGQGAAGTARSLEGADTYVTAEFLWSSRNPVLALLGGTWMRQLAAKPQNALRLKWLRSQVGAGACQLGLQNKKAICGTGSGPA